MVRWFKDNIILSYALLVLGKYFGIISNEMSCVIVTLLLIIYIIKTKRIQIPHVRGMKFYAVYAVLLAIYGFAFYSVRSVARDVFYILPTIEFIILGYYYQKKERDENKIFRSVIYVGACIAIINIIKVLISPSNLTSLTAIRGIFTSGSYEVVMAGIVAFVASIAGTDYQIRHMKVIQLLLLIDTVLSFSRSVWVEFLLGCFIILMACQKRGTLSIRTFRVVSGALVVLLLLLFIGQYILPDSVVTEYVNKLLDSSQEINAGSTFNSVQEATNNWRAYEMQSAINEWKNGSIFQQVFGFGIGKGIYIQYVPATWVSMVESNRIPLLHSAYHTYLVKGGIIGLLSLIWFMLAPMYDSYRRLKRKHSSEYIGFHLVLIGVCTAFMIQSYVVRGPIVQNANISWAMLVGWISSCFWQESSDRN